MNIRTATFGSAIILPLAWALVWALPGGLIEAIDNLAPSAHSFTRRIDMWPQTLGLPGLVGGVLFAVVLAMSEGRRRLAEVPLPRAGGWGAVSGLLVGALVVWFLGWEPADSWLAAAAVVASAALLGALSGIACVLGVRYAGKRVSAAVRAEG